MCYWVIICAMVKYTGLMKWREAGWPLSIVWSWTDPLYAEALMSRSQPCKVLRERAYQAEVISTVSFLVSEGLGCVGGTEMTEWLEQTVVWEEVAWQERGRSHEAMHIRIGGLEVFLYVMSWSLGMMIGFKWCQMLLVLMTDVWAMHLLFIFPSL